MCYTANHPHALCIVRKKNVTMNVVIALVPLRSLLGKCGRDRIRNGCVLGFFVVFFPSRARPVILELKELCSPQTCFLHTQQYWGTRAWLERTGWSTIASRVFRIRHMRQHPGRDIGPLGSDWQQEPTWLTSSTPDDREVQPDKAVLMLPTWQPPIIIHSSQSAACTLSISTWSWRKSLFSWTWPFPVQWSDGQPSRQESLVDK